MSAGRPPAIQDFDQGSVTPETTVSRVLFLEQNGDLWGKDILVLGAEDDLTGLAIALTRKARRVLVLDIDARLVDFDNRAFRELGIDNAEARVFDLRNPLPKELLGAFDVFVSDPPETLASFRAFIGRGIAALREEGAVGYFGLTLRDASVYKWREFQRLLTGEFGVVITDILQNFNHYMNWDYHPHTRAAQIAPVAHPREKFGTARPGTASKSFRGLCAGTNRSTTTCSTSTRKERRPREDRRAGSRRRLPAPPSPFGGGHLWGKEGFALSPSFRSNRGLPFRRRRRRRGSGAHLPQDSLKRRFEVDGKDDHRAPLGSDLSQGLQIPQGNCIRILGDEAGGVHEAVGRLVFPVGEDDLGAAFAFGFRLGGNRPLHARGELDVSNLHRAHLDPQGSVPSSMISLSREFTASRWARSSSRSDCPTTLRRVVWAS